MAERLIGHLRLWCASISQRVFDHEGFACSRASCVCAWGQRLRPGPKSCSCPTDEVQTGLQHGCPKALRERADAQGPEEVHQAEQGAAFPKLQFVPRSQACGEN